MTTDDGPLQDRQVIEAMNPYPCLVEYLRLRRPVSIDALFDGSGELVEIIEDLTRLGAQLIIQTAVWPK
jgi:hypothetical protein